ncbi:hypothetical protein FQA47_010944 [Oryzias melastigma]|uniref:Uncharacterized protein n=1 Tax=Oryzias melastigma TaxID=30732 RepID=A0A834C147_ORYME|nr:hypothetical protein FQA47_010944 [Oryzias melastigma]
MAPESRGDPKQEKTHEPADGLPPLLQRGTGCLIGFPSQGLLLGRSASCDGPRARVRVQPPQSSLHKLTTHTRAHRFLRIHRNAPKVSIAEELQVEEEEMHPEGAEEEEEGRTERWRIQAGDAATARQLHFPVMPSGDPRKVE